LDLLASTIRGNQAYTDGGGVYNEAFTAGLNFTLTSSLVQSNTAGDAGGGIFTSTTGAIVRLGGDAAAGGIAEPRGNGADEDGAGAGMAGVQLHPGKEQPDRRPFDPNMVEIATENVGDGGYRLGEDAIWHGAMHDMVPFAVCGVC